MFGGIASMALFIHPQIRYHRCHSTLHLNFLGPHTHPHHPQNVRFNLSITDVRWKYSIHDTTWNNKHSINHYFFSANSSSSSPIVLTDELSGTGSTESISDIETDIDHFHRVNINTHGRKLNLELSPIQHLLSKRSAFENTWFADAYPNNVSYTPSPKVSKI